jgi:hypothetical protein
LGVSGTTATAGAATTATATVTATAAAATAASHHHSPPLFRKIAYVRDVHYELSHIIVIT